MDSKELREKFIKFFTEYDHKEMPPASLIPENDPSVLFTTAGMQQFKRFYTNPQEAPATNVVTCQPVFRTSDIEEVGDDTHLTFFEMLGNFSFDGYFSTKGGSASGGKKEAIEMGYEFLTKELGIETDKIWCSIFKGDDINTRDNESAEILNKMDIKFKEFDRDDTFWGPTGEEGPCGPAVEMYVDNIEVWTLVFNEYFKEKEGTYRPLETKGVDTGMGLERMLSTVNELKNIYETDLFESLIKKIEEISRQKYNENIKEFRIIADHVKATVFAINDNILPSNKDRGYIVRRLIRRAIVKGTKINIKQEFITSLAEVVFETYNGVYKFKTDEIIDVLNTEEEKFRQTLEKGLKNFENQKENLNGKIAFDLYQTYGFPWEMTAELAEQENIEVDKSEFEAEFKKHQELSRTASAGMFKGGLATGGEVETKYHTATHLLLAALREILGPETNQKGANITAERIRFDFNYPEKLTDEQIKKIEDWVNDKIGQNLEVTMEEMPLKKALEEGATSIPGFKYPETVKVFNIGSSTSSESSFSREICGGPHVEKTGDLGHFKIIKEESSSSGIRRIKAILE